MKILFALILCTVLLVGCSNSNNSSQNNNNYNSQTLSYEQSIKNTTNNINNNSNDNTSNTDTNTDSNNINENTPTEETISSFSTKVSQKDPDRQTNITIACQTLTGTIVKSGESFSFCNTLGPAKPEDGYKKADTFDSNGNTIQAYGGGKCQVSSTLYNAVLACPGLTTIERHTHSGDVFYVPEGKDACVAYGSCDFKFRNDNDFDIKMYFSNTPDSIDVRIVKNFS